MTYEVGAYNGQNVRAFLETRPEVQDAASLATHLAQTGPEGCEDMIGREHIMTFGALSGAYDLAARPYPFVIAGLVGLDRRNPLVFSRREIEFPQIPKGALAPAAYADVDPGKRLKRFLEPTPYYPLRPFAQVVKVGDLPRLVDPENYRNGASLLNVLNLSTRQKLGVMVDFIFDEVLPYYNG